MSVSFLLQPLSERHCFCTHRSMQSGERTPTVIFSVYWTMSESGAAGDEAGEDNKPHACATRHSAVTVTRRCAMLYIYTYIGSKHAPTQ